VTAVHGPVRILTRAVATLCPAQVSTCSYSARGDVHTGNARGRSSADADPRVIRAAPSHLSPDMGGNIPHAAPQLDPRRPTWDAILKRLAADRLHLSRPVASPPRRTLRRRRATRAKLHPAGPHHHAGSPTLPGLAVQRARLQTRHARPIPLALGRLPCPIFRSTWGPRRAGTGLIHVTAPRASCRVADTDKQWDRAQSGALRMKVPERPLSRVQWSYSGPTQIFSGFSYCAFIRTSSKNPGYPRCARR
jgi:hypothetical protein